MNLRSANLEINGTERYSLHDSAYLEPTLLISDKHSEHFLHLTFQADGLEKLIHALQELRAKYVCNNCAAPAEDFGPYRRADGLCRACAESKGG